MSSSHPCATFQYAAPTCSIINLHTDNKLTTDDQTKLVRSTGGKGRILGVLLDTADFLEVVERLQVSLLAEDVALEEPGEPGVKLVAGVPAGRHAKDVVELFECELLSLRQEEEDENESGNVESSVEAKGTGGSHGGDHTRPEETEDTGPEETSSDGPTHADLTVGDWEYFGRVGEWNGSLSNRVLRC